MTAKGLEHRAMLGLQAEATWLADLLGLDNTELCIPKASDPTPSTAALYLERNGRVMLMDFLAHITGLNNDELRRYAADVDIPMPDGRSVPLRVLDPVHCLLRRIHQKQASWLKKQEANAARG